MIEERRGGFHRADYKSSLRPNMLTFKPRSKP